ncbi:MAG: DUF3501 family protein [Alphaproteobacteria bacterium]
MATKREITRDDIMPAETYALERKQRKRANAALKRDRRLDVGPFTTFYFESFETMWMQIHEMLYIERGGEDQIAGELDAYNPLIPTGNELVATFMIEIDDPERRQRTLATLGGIEGTIAMQIGDESVRATYETDVERTTPDGVASSVHFIRFPLSADLAARFKRAGTRVVLVIGHANYGHMAVMPETTRAALATDLD